MVLDLNGDGITTQSIASGVEFDLFATGQKVNTGWVTGGDGLLVMDRNHDGAINNGSELFGQATQLANGDNAANGYVALSALDLNGDGLITSADAGFSDLRVWVDGNSDGVSQAGELRTLDSLGISKLNLAAATSWENNNGNFEGLVSSYETTDGAKHEMADVWFVTDKNASAASVQDSSTVVQATDLSSSVGSLVQAISTFNASQLTSTNASALPGVDSSTAVSVSAGTLVAATNVGGMVDALKQFDTNGNSLAASVVVPSVLAVPVLTAPNLPNPAAAGILATGK